MCYSKLFDMFDPCFYVDMLQATGLPSALGGALENLYGRLTPRIKIAGSFGKELKPTIGMGQGCSISILPASATVTSEFNMFDSVTPTVANETFVDDRTLECHDCGGLKRAVEAGVEMEGLMGHSTNVDKSKFLATSRTTR